MNNTKSFPLEFIFWVTALVLLATANPHEHHFSLCPLANLGITWCPGCGLGRSISALFHGQLSESLSFHWLGLPALLLMVYRMIQLSTTWIKGNKKFNLNYKED